MTESFRPQTFAIVGAIILFLVFEGWFSHIPYILTCSFSRGLHSFHDI